MESHTSTFRVRASAPPNKQTCTQCRWRKVRCEPGSDAITCGSCTRLGLACSFADPAGDRRSSDRQPRRLRGPIACLPCREKKIRCSGTAPCCANCTRRGLNCVYPSPKRGSAHVAAPLASPSLPAHSASNHPGGGIISQTSTSPTHAEPNIDSVLVPAGLVDPTLEPHSNPDPKMGLVDAFFEHVYPLPSFAFLHPSTTKRRCREGAQPGSTHSCLRAAVCAVAALYLDHGRESQAVGWTEQAEQSVWQNLASPTVPMLQTLLLVIHHRMGMGLFQRAFMLTATAARFAAAMRLHHERTDLDPVAREVRRRLVWSFKIIERYFSSGLPEYELCPDESVFLDFPSPEEEFCTPETLLGGQPERGALGINVRLESARRDIMKLTRSVAVLDRPLPSLMELIQHHEKSLEDIGAMIIPLPSPGHVTALLDSPWLPREVLIHLSWHQAHCDIYRTLLAGYPEGAPRAVLAAVDPARVAEAERMCLHHALAIIQILTTLNQASTRRLLLEFDTAICGFHAVRLVLFLSRFGGGGDGDEERRPSLEFALSRAELTLAALKRFFPSSTLVAPIIEELPRLARAFLLQQQNRDLRRQRDQVDAIETAATMTSMASVIETPLDDAGSTSVTAQEDSGQTPSSAATSRQRLAIHSLLRQAEFDDKGDEEDMPGGSANVREITGHAAMQVTSPDCRTMMEDQSSPSSSFGWADVHPSSFTLGWGGGWDWDFSSVPPAT